MNEEKIQNEINKLKSLKNIKDLAIEKLYEMARQNVEEKEADERALEGLSLTDRKEEKEYLYLFNKYRKGYHLSSASDEEILKQICYWEILYKRLQHRLDKIEKAEGSPSVPITVIKTLNDIQTQIVELKEKVGLFEEKKQDDPFQYIQRLKDRFRHWREENQASRFRICPHCSKTVLWMVRAESYDALKHPFFKDRYLTNDHLWQLYRENKITKLDMAKVLLGNKCESTDYIDWLEKKLAHIDNTKKIESV
jgi:hypothetical protein